MRFYSSDAFCTANPWNTNVIFTCLDGWHPIIRCVVMRRVNRTDLTMNLLPAFLIIAIHIVGRAVAEPTVTLDNGTFTGTASGNVSRFLGVPYAQPPWVLNWHSFALKLIPRFLVWAICATAFPKHFHPIRETTKRHNMAPLARNYPWMSPP